MAQSFSGQRLRAKRIAAGYKPEQLAQMIGRGVYSVLDYEQCRTQPPVRIAAALAAALGCTVDDLLDDVVMSRVAV
jgi:transcriptional regulator with XRE-family HTH domain